MISQIGVNIPGILLGNDASRSWHRLRTRHPPVAARYTVITTRHTSPQAFVGTSDERTRWQAEQLAAFRSAAETIKGDTSRPWITT